MSATKWVLTIIGVFLGIWILGLVFNVFGTASKMAEKTYLNADKNVWSYEEFHRKYEAYQQYTKQIEQAEKSLKDLEDKGVTSGQRYDNLSMEIDGSRQMKNRIAQEYNAMSEIAYQAMWKSKGLPEKLE
jgi:chromosome segregation ATPase